MLPYTLERLWTQRAVIERDQATTDAYGADAPPVWQYLATVPCLLWWDKSSGARSANRTYVTPAREVPISAGGILLPVGSDVTEDDRIVEIQDADGNTLIEGIFLITAALNQGTHMELSVERAHLGA